MPDAQHLADEPPASRSRRSHRAAVTGTCFTVLLLVSAGMATVPGGDDPAVRVRSFYLSHSGVVLAAQVIGLAAAGVFALFARAVGPAGDSRPGSGLVRQCGYGVAVAAAGTAVPVVWLCFAASNASSRLLHGLAVASDWTDVVLFAFISGFAVSVASSTTPRWLRAVAVVVFLVTGARAVLLATGASALEVAAPLAFLALVASLVVVDLRRGIR